MYPVCVAVAEPVAFGAAPGWVDAERFVVEEELGRGGMGTVYRAFDRRRLARVALKTLHSVDPAAVLLFKQEFRSLADVSHPNLVTLYELFSGDDCWYFTMELIAGVSFRAWVRAGLPTEEPELEVTAETRPVSTGSGRRGGGGGPVHLLPPPPLDDARVARLRGALRQLVQGVHALHEAGKLHRDIKPSNILCTPEGRAVLLDFGLVTDVAPAGGTLAPTAGTAPYMSPEQAAGMALSPASDWYAVGVVLYEALTGRHPHRGGADEVLRAKQLVDPAAPRDLQPELPEDLDTLCMELLRRDPATRPHEEAILGRALAGRARAARSSSPVAELVGRELHLDALDDAFQATRQGNAVTVYVHGAAGSGKTALLRALVDDLARREEEVIVLAGRCYESESVPFKALDSVIDALGRALAALPPAEVAALLPADAAALPRLFPALGRAGPLAELRPAAAADPQELRRRAFAALRQLLRNLAQRRRVVALIDDLQWGDLDSVALLTELMRPPDAPPLLLLTTFRGEERDTNATLRALLGTGPLAAGAPGVRQLALGPLPAGEVRRMAATLCPEATPAQVEAVVREAGGNPFFITELAWHLAGGDALSAGRVSLDALLHARLAQLGAPSLRLLEVVAVAGQPTDVAVATRVAETGDGYLQALAQLRGARMVRVESGERERIEAYHDRIRQAALALIPPERARRLHQGLAVELAAAGDADPEQLAVHFLAAGAGAEALTWVAAAADRAAATLAFDRAAALYRQALALLPAVAPEARAFRVKLGDALAAAGRGGEAAQEYLAAVEGAAPAEVLDLRRRAAEQQLISGHLVNGLATIGTVLTDLGMSLPRTPGRALASLLARRARLRLRTMGRGWRFEVRDAATLPPLELARIDACWSIAVGLAMNDHIHGADFQTRNLLLTLAAGEPYRAVRALAAESAYMATLGRPARAKSDELVRATAELAERLDQPYGRGMSVGAAGMAAYLLGERERARELCERAETIFSEECTGVAWELNTVRIFLVWSLFYLGRFGELTRRVPRLLRDALARGDRYAATDLRIGLPNAAWLAADELADARRHVDEATAERVRTSYHLQDYYELLARSQIDLYAGDGAAAAARIDAAWPALKKSLLLRIQNLRIEASFLRARAALAAGGVGAKAAERDARRLAGERVPWATALAALVRAGAAAARGDAGRAVALLEAAEAGFAAAEMRLFAAAARRRRGGIVGDTGELLVATADEWMGQHRIVNAERMTALLAPGFAA